ncbi:AAA family ATPase [Gillisia limnaea]|uniref:SMC domain protein n=1 Tax=Gillisia limnaea (strain DSM 15749 / LMG 21470 / R-8282) TaxID=865937 RepID=H2BRR1_GILLR|nr:AAA family ATPase [Gillisia limnaea]EHQ01376.1 SMC domain protein [Gillisia limnaea DSM 15749]
MKILKIEFQNINSLRGIHKIDFTKAPFTTSSLFAITGPTGSGKSTILDVISLALFNQVPRLGKISRKEIEEKGAILTRNQKEAFATVTYECKSGEYASTWSISTARTGNLRDYEMQIAEVGSGELLDLKKSDVPASNEALIGLNYNQFIKSVLLAQGEFAQFLRAKKEERGELLEKITGTGMYRQLGIKAFEKFREVNAVIKAQQDKILVIKDELLENEKKQEITKELQQKEQESKPLEVALKSISKNIELKEAITIREKEIRVLELKKEAEENNFKRFNAEFGPGLKNHEKLQNYAEELRSWSHQKIELQRKNEEKEIKGAGIEKNLQEQKNCLESTGKFIGTEITSDTISEEVEHFGRKVSDLQQKRAERSTEYKTLKLQLQRELENVSFSLNEKDPDVSLKTLNELKNASEKAIKEFQKELKNIDLERSEAEKQRLNKGLEEAITAKQEHDTIDKTVADIEKLDKETELLLPKIAAFPGEIAIATNRIELFKERRDKLDLEKHNQVLRASLEEHRAHLINGEACPLCGSFEHPFAEELPKQDSDLQKKIVETAADLKTWTDKLTAATTSFKHFEERQREINSQKAVLETELKSHVFKFEEEFPQFQLKENRVWEQLFRNYRTQLKLLEEYEKENGKLKAIQIGMLIHLKLNKVLSEGVETKAELDKLYLGTDIHKDCGKFQQKWSALKQDHTGLTNQLKELQTRTEEQTEIFRNLELELSELVKDQYFVTIAEAREALLPELDYNRLRSQREKIKNDLGIHLNSLKLLTTQLQDFQKQDVEKTAEALTSELKQCNALLQSITSECEDLRRKLKNDKDRREQLEKLEAGIAEKEKQNKRWKLLNELIGDSQGKKFNDFAQDLSLSQLLQHANIRLADLSDRYKIDKPTAQEDDGLVAIDEHMGGQRRSVKTLSGGETFILSLSMALALSDLASRNVEINSLFIDEGFGTLDPETLDQTLDTLEKLQSESSKTIGIISHVDSLKERIATQIQLKRHGQGYSTLDVSS